MLKDGTGHSVEKKLKMIGEEERSLRLFIKVRFWIHF